MLFGREDRLVGEHDLRWHGHRRSNGVRLRRLEAPGVWQTQTRHGLDVVGGRGGAGGLFSLDVRVEADHGGVMKAVIFREHGGADKLEYTDVPDPKPSAG